MPISESGDEPGEALRAALIGAGLGALVELPALLAAFASAGFGHGDYVLARMLFPIPMLLTLFFGGYIGPPLIVLGLLQFPIYGAIFAWARARGDYRPVIGLTVLHIAAFVACFSGLLPYFE